MNTTQKTNFKDLGWLILRIGIGVGLATHGYAKLFTLNYNGTPTVEAFSRIVATIGFPYPLYFAYAAALSEFVGGILIAIGLFGRVAGLFAGFTMAVALYRHWGDPFGTMELAFVYFMGCLAILCMGSGQLSLDQMLAGVRFRKSSGGNINTAQEVAEEEF